MKLSDSKVFEPINTLTEELLHNLNSVKGDYEMSLVQLKIALMKAYNSGRNKALDDLEG